jgi:basic membrane lipoprotein Med (substrate-binding protein (PBP1-ABC) superfamily)
MWFRKWIAAAVRTTGFDAVAPTAGPADVNAANAIVEATAADATATIAFVRPDRSDDISLTSLVRSSSVSTTE